MQKGFLPSRKHPPQESPQDPLNEVFYRQDNPVVDGLNLLGRAELFHKDKEIRYQIIIFFQVCIFLVASILLILTIINVAYDYKLAGVRDESIALTDRLSKYDETLNEARKISGKLTKYANIQKTRKTLSGQTATLTAAIKEYTILKSLIGRQDSFTIQTESRSAANVVNLLSKLLTSGNVSQVSLKQVNYFPTRDIYDIQMEGMFK